MGAGRRTMNRFRREVLPTLESPTTRSLYDALSGAAELEVVS